MTNENARERYKKLYLANENPKALSRSTALEEEENRILKSLSDCLIVHKITGNENDLKESEDLLSENDLQTLRTAELHEEKSVADDYEAVLRKELQTLQADERGRRALQNEAAEMKKQQLKRLEALKARERALTVEKERAKRIASRPPPLPRSVVMLMKEHEKKEAEVSTEEILQVSQHFIDAEDDNSEDKENVIDARAEEGRRKLQEERDVRAKQRFNEAIRKEHQKQEHAEILKEIENAEKLNRRQLAKSVAVKGGRVPCSVPDNIFHTGQQVAMEDKVERIFKNNTKEHAVEDLEGYEDYWETKYKKIDSKMQERMIDCVPNFVKENYAYLLADESSLCCGRRFSGLDESHDELNMAYIDSPLSGEELERYEETDAIINHLDKMQKETNEKIEKEFKPLLEAKDAPKTESVDKAVGTDILKRPTEHKAVGVHTESPKDQIAVESKSVGVDLNNGGLMGYKVRSDFGSRFGDIGSQFALLESAPAAGQESWSSSSYWSLPSKHGLPNVCNLCDSPNCNVPLVEHRSPVKSYIPLSKSKEEEAPDTVGESNRNGDEAQPQNESSSASTSDGKSKLSYYVQMVADKYLKNPSTKSLNRSSSGIDTEKVESRTEEFGTTENEPREIDVGSHDTRNSLQAKGPSVRETSEIVTDPEFADSIRNAFSEASVDLNPRTDFIKTVQASNCRVSEQNLPENPVFASKKSLIIDMDEAPDDVFLRKCHEVISDNLLGMFSHPDPTGAVASAEVCYSASDGNEATRQPYVYHELSTIQELDSALTNDGNRSTSKRSLSSTGNTSGKSERTSDGSDRLNITPISLVDAPPAAVSELAKSIRFLKKASPKKAEHMSREHSRFPEELAKSPQTPEAKLQSSAVGNASGFSSVPGSEYDSPLTLRTAESGTVSPLTSYAQSVHHVPQLTARSDRHSPKSDHHSSKSYHQSPKYAHHSLQSTHDFPLLAGSLSTHHTTQSTNDFPLIAGSLSTQHSPSNKHSPQSARYSPSSKHSPPPARHSPSNKHSPQSARHSPSNKDSPPRSCHSPSNKHSPQSARQSPLSIASQGLPFMHAFSSPYKNQYHLAALTSLPKYFPDISSIHHGSGSSASSQYGGSQSSKTTTDNENLPVGNENKTPQKK